MYFAAFCDALRDARVTMRVRRFGKEVVFKAQILEADHFLYACAQLFNAVIAGVVFAQVQCKAFRLVHAGQEGGQVVEVLPAHKEGLEVQIYVFEVH